MKFISNDSIISFMGYHKILDYSQMDKYHLINIILKLTAIVLTENTIDLILVLKLVI